jgi:tetratricopeptide (TPR) repeat protein
MRFFLRAIEVYDQGLRRFPSSLDLAYNKARVLLEIATHPALVKHLQAPILVVLQQALEAHHYALSLDQENSDTLFNTAQVLTAIAEIHAKTGTETEALRLLEGALDLQSRCLGIQELKLEESLQQQKELEEQFSSDSTAVDFSQNHASTSTSQGEPARNAGPEEQWFSVVEPVTKATLVDTILAELGTLTTLCSILNSTAVSVPSSTLAWVEESSRKLINTKLPVLLDESEPELLQEVALVRANFVSNFLEAGYRAGSIDLQTYKKERDDVFKSPDLDLEKSYACLTGNANSLIAFASSAIEVDPTTLSTHASQIWNALSAAITNLAAATKVSDSVPDEIAETHFIRGNCSLLQYRLGQPPASYQTAVNNASQLLKNANVFYRNAEKLYQDEERKAVAAFRSHIVQALQNGDDPVASAGTVAQTKGVEWVQNQFSDMADEGLATVEHGSS